MKRSLAAGLSAIAIAVAGPAAAYDGWKILDATKIDSKTSAFDYITFDRTANRLFIGHRKEGLQVFDLGTKKVVKVIDGTEAASSNGALLIPELDLGISNNENGTIIPFKLSTLAAQAPIKLGEELDTSHYDPLTKRIFVNMAAGKDGTDIIVLDAATLKQVGVVKIAARKPEHAEADGKGNFYLASRDLDKIYRIDTKELKVTAEWATPGCGQTNSVALDTANNRVLIACRGNDKVKPSFNVINADTGAVTFSAEIGGGNDGIVFDPETKRVFTANGLSSTLDVFEQTGPDAYKRVETILTRPFVKVLAYDPKTKRIYSMTAEGAADFSKKVNTAISPFYANTFFPNTFTVLTVGKN